MGALKDCKIVKNKTVSATVFEGLFEDKTFLDVVYDTSKALQIDKLIEELKNNTFVMAESKPAVQGFIIK